MPPKRMTRSGGPPQSAAVVNPTRTSSKKKKRARQAGTTQGQRPISSGTTAGATEDAGDADFLHLSRLAKELRDAAVGHPGAQGALLDFLQRNWTTQGGDEVPFQSAPTNKHLSDSYEEQDDYVESNNFSVAERVVNQALQFLVTVRSGMHAKLPVGILPNASFVYSSMQLALVSAPSGFFGFLT